MSVPPFGLIRVAQDLARDFHTLSGRHSGDGAATLIAASNAIWVAIRTLETPPPRMKRGERRARKLLHRPDMRQ